MRASPTWRGSPGPGPLLEARVQVCEHSRVMYEVGPDARLRVDEIPRLRVGRGRLSAP